jgi:3-hydroxybutyrate dehydrogenase
MRAAMPGMRAKGWGRVVNIASAHGLVASVHKAAYVAAKHGLVGLSKVAGLEYANAGVTVNVVNPGWVLTPLVEAQIAARAAANGSDVQTETEAMLREKQEMLRFSTPEHIGAAVRFLCSEGAATMTGSTLQVDGGWTAR